jgi:tetratricopeptide (TPR) repeat protein
VSGTERPEGTGRTEREPEPPESVLEILERKTGEAPSVSLSDAGSGDAGPPIALDPTTEVRFSSRNRGNYQVLGEIARGGMGAILRGHDRDLRRDVAIKVLDPRLAEQQEVVRRFVEEAQIGAQLQHPGVVPVYELGLMADERPFFTMKLVKGRTLASLLGARKSPAAELRRFLAIFEQICQTMAYAHTKGVLHRDLKPANVMVGAFGEVQVVDWGLAKVLSRGGVADEKRAIRERESQRTIIETVRSGQGSGGTDSVVGSVMGTPAYMPPEQARGELDGLDERADVFALGAILCEVLTGAPPYVEGGGTSPTESVVQQAARGHLAPARERLAASKADEELVKLCLGCLAPAPQARPSSAEEVARGIHEYLSGTEERARAAQLAAAEARVQAAEEGKRRRLTLALAGALVLLLLALGGGYVVISEQREGRLEALRRQVDGMQAEVVELQGAGQHDQALAKAREALSFVEQEEIGGDLRERLAGFVMRAEGLAAEAHTRSELEARNRAFFARLDELELQRSGLGISTTNEELDRAYAEAFRDYGIDVEATDVVEVLSTLRERGLGAELAFALDPWARVRRALFGSDAPEPEALTALAADLDPDPMRTEVRAALLRQDKEGLFRLQREVDLDAAPPATLWVLVSAVADLGGDPSALLERCVRRHPGDPRFRVLLGTELMKKNQYAVALQHLVAAHAVQPDNASTMEKLASVLANLGDFPANLRLLRELEIRAPGYTGGTNAFALLMLGDYAAAIEAYDQVEAVGRLDEGAAVEREAALYLAGEYSASELGSAMEALPFQTAYKEQAQCWALCHRPGADRSDYERALALVKRVHPFTSADALTKYCLGVAYMRLERWAQALEALDRLAFADLRGDIAFGSASMRAIALHELGQTEEARAALADARAFFSNLSSTEPEAWQRSTFYEWLREAEARVR